MKKLQFMSAVKMGATVVLGLQAGLAKAQTDSGTLYHALTTTYGCEAPEALRSLVNPRESRRSNPAWVKDIYARGHCVTITQVSPWKVLSHEGDLAYVSYAGTVGPAGSYYVVGSVFVDPLGRHPGDVVGDAAPATAMPANPSSATALAPPSDNSMAIGATETGSSSWLIWLPAILIVIGIAGLLTWVALERRKRVSTVQQSAALALATAEIEKLSPKLHARRIELTTPDIYGTVDRAKWEGEKEAVFRTRLVPLLEANGYRNAIASVKPAIFAELDRWTSERQLQPNSV